MRFFTGIFLSILTLARTLEMCEIPRAINSCVTFSVTSGTGCAWMCNYCANALGTNNYYFTDGICQYQTGGCVGNPQSGTQYTCCSA